MKRTILTKIRDSFRYAADWFSETPERALEQAYNAALQIKAIEDEYFGGKKIAADSTDYGDSEISYFRAELQKNLNIAKRRLAEFKASNSVIGISNYNQTAAKAEVVNAAANNGNGYPQDSRDKSSIILEKLKFIDRVISKYSPKAQRSQSEKSLALVAVAKNKSSDS